MRITLSDRLIVQVEGSIASLLVELEKDCRDESILHKDLRNLMVYPPDGDNSQMRQIIVPQESQKK